MSQEKEVLKNSVEMFISTLKVTKEKAREIEANTRDQRLSPQWFAACRFQLTASMFGSVMTRKPDTPPNNLCYALFNPNVFLQKQPNTALTVNQWQSSVM